MLNPVASQQREFETLQMLKKIQPKSKKGGAEIDASKNYLCNEAVVDAGALEDDSACAKFLKSAFPLEIKSGATRQSACALMADQGVSVHLP